MSSDMMSYLLYMQTWDGESDENIDAIISEHHYFKKLAGFDATEAVNTEFKTLDDLACDVRDTTIAANVLQISADAAAIGAIWSFGFGMAAFAALEAAKVIDEKSISSKSKELNTKLSTIDSDIAAKVNPDVYTYVTMFKKNNNLIVSKAAKGMDVHSCRASLMQFLGQVEKKTTLNVATFKQYASSAKMLFKSDQITAVCDALDELNFSAKTKADSAKMMNTLSGLNYPEAELSMVRSLSIAIMFYKLNVANKTIEATAKEAGLPVEEVDASAFEVMDVVGKFVAVVAIAMSVVDVILDILDIVDVVKQCNAMCDKLNSKFKPSYLDYFSGMKNASRDYNQAMAKSAAFLATLK